MFEAIAGFVFKLISGPFIEAYKAHLEAGTSHDTLAQGLAIRELEVQQKEAEIQGQYKTALIGHWYEPANLCAYVLVFFMAKVIVYDTMLGLGVTPALKGDVAAWAGMVMAFLFGKRGVENVAMILKGWK